MLQSIAFTFIAPSVEYSKFIWEKNDRHLGEIQDINFSVDGAINVEAIDYSKSLCNANNKVWQT